VYAKWICVGGKVICAVRVQMKEIQYDSHSNLRMLVDVWVSQASARQRRGRAGRVQEGALLFRVIERFPSALLSLGYCFRMFGKAQFTELPSQQVPEIQRVPLENLILQSK